MTGWLTSPIVALLGEVTGSPDVSAAGLVGALALSMPAAAHTLGVASRYVRLALIIAHLLVTGAMTPRVPWPTQPADTVTGAGVGSARLWLRPGREGCTCSSSTG
jgi:hypothetical protein